MFYNSCDMIFLQRYSFLQSYENCAMKKNAFKRCNIKKKLITCVFYFFSKQQVVVYVKRANSSKNKK